MKKWKLLSKKDISPHRWFPLEMRTYELPDGRIVDDFSVTTLADVAMIVPVTTEGQVVLAKQYKPGVDEVILEFPAGRLEESHADLVETAIHELEEETGIKGKKENFQHFGRLTGFSTKATEVVHLFFIENCVFNSTQNLDANEDIEVVTLYPTELDKKIQSGEIWASQTIAAWELAKKNFSIII